MPTSITPPFIPPDNSTITVTNGQLAIKDAGVDGSTKLQDDSVTLAKIDTTGATSGLYLKANGAGVAPSWSAITKNWTWLQTLSPSSVTTIDSSALTAYAEYMIRIRVASTGANDTLSLRMGKGGSVDTGNNYDTRTMTTTIANTNNTSAITLCTTNSNTMNEVVIELNAVSAPTASGRVQVTIKASASQAGTIGIEGSYIAGNAQQINIFRFFTPTTSFTGTIEIFGRNAGD